MQKRKWTALLVALAMLVSFLALPSLTASAVIKTVEPKDPEGTPGNTGHPRLMYPGYVHWMNFKDMVNPWGTGLNFTEHVWSDFAKQQDMASHVYYVLDRDMQAMSTADGKENFPQGLFKTDNATHYRDLLWFGTFQGTRVDHAYFGKGPNNKIDYYVYPDTYVAATLVLSDYWIFSSGDARYEDLHKQYEIYTSPDRSDWTQVDQDDINYYWEHGAEDGSIPVNSYMTAIATIKMPENHMYYRIVCPWFSGNDWAAAAVGPVKVSLSSMFDGAEGDATAETYYAPSEVDKRLLEFNPVEGKLYVKTKYPLSVQALLPWIALSEENGSFNFRAADGSKIQDLNTVVEDGMKLRVSDVNGNEMLDFEIEIIDPEDVTIGYYDSKKALNPGVVDMVKLHPIAELSNGEWNNYSDYAFGYEAAQSIVALSKQGHYFHGSLFGEEAMGAYRVWSAGEYKGVQYRVVPESYISTALLIHGSIVAETGENAVLLDEDTIKEAVMYFKIYTSPDGLSWERIELTKDMLSLEHGVPGMKRDWNGNKDESISGFVAVRSTVKIPEGHRYYLVEIPDYYHLDFAYVGASKASLTDMTGDQVGDDVVAWYELPELFSRDLGRVIVNELTGVMTVLTDEGQDQEQLTLSEVMEKLGLTMTYLKFFDADGNEITDLGTIISGEMKMKYYNSSTDDEIQTFSIDNQVTEAPEEPGIESKDESKVVVDEDNDRIIVKVEGLTYQDLLDLLNLKGDATLVFVNEDGDEIEDLDTALVEGSFAELYSTVFLGEYEIGFDITKDKDPGDDAPATADATSAFLVLLVLSVLALAVGRRRKTAQ